MLFVFGFWIPQGSVGEKFIILNLTSRIITAMSVKGVGSVLPCASVLGAEKSSLFHPESLSMVLELPSNAFSSSFKDNFCPIVL